MDLDLTNPRQFTQAQDLYDRLRALYDSGDIREGELQTLQDLHTQLMPIWEQEAARAQPMIYDPQVGVPELGIEPEIKTALSRLRDVAVDTLPPYLVNNTFGRPASDDFLDRIGLMGISGADLATRLADAPVNAYEGNYGTAAADLGLGALGLLGLVPGGALAKGATRVGSRAPAAAAAVDPAIQRADEVLGLIKSGRADEVTDEMLDMGDPVLNARMNEYLFNNYDLPMDAASRAERSKKYPTQDVYSGTGDDFASFNDLSVYASDNPDVAFTYAPPAGGSIMPLVMRAKNGAPVINAGGASWSRLTPSMREGGPMAPYLPGILRDPEDIAKYGEDLLKTRDFEKEAKWQGFSGLTFNDIVDVGPYLSKYFPSGPQREAQRESIMRAGQPSTVETRFYPNQVRSRFARFDPRLAHLKNLNAALTAGVPLGLLSMTEEEPY